MTSKIAEIFESMDYGPAPEADAPARGWITAHEGKMPLFINGRFVPGSEHFESINPADGKPLAQIS